MFVRLSASLAAPLAGEIVVEGPGGPSKTEAFVTSEKSLGFGVILDWGWNPGFISFLI